MLRIYIYIFYTYEKKKLTVARRVTLLERACTGEAQWPSICRRFINGQSPEDGAFQRRERINSRILFPLSVHPLATLWTLTSRASYRRIVCLNERGGSKKNSLVFTPWITPLGGRDGDPREVCFSCDWITSVANFTTPDSPPFRRRFYRETQRRVPSLCWVMYGTSGPVVTSREVISKVKWGKVCDVFVLGVCRDEATYCVPQDSRPCVREPTFRDARCYLKNRKQGILRNHAV